MFHLDYARLLADFLSEAGGMLEFAGCDAPDMAALEESVSLESLHGAYGDSDGVFLRKAVVGDFRRTIRSPRILSELRQVESMETEELDRRLAVEAARVARRERRNRILGRLTGRA